MSQKELTALQTKVANALNAGHSPFTANKTGYTSHKFITTTDADGDTNIIFEHGGALREMSKRDFHAAGWTVNCEMNSATSVARI